jgi:hypothetical protein
MRTYGPILLLIIAIAHVALAASEIQAWRRNIRSIQAEKDAGATRDDDR